MCAIHPPIKNYEDKKWCWVHQTFTYKKSFRVRADGDIDAIMQALKRKDPDRISLPLQTNTDVEYETEK